MQFEAHPTYLDLFTISFLFRSIGTKVSYSLHFIFSILELCSVTLKSKSGRSQLREKSKNELQIKQVSHNDIK